MMLEDFMLLLVIKYQEKDISHNNFTPTANFSF